MLQSNSPRLVRLTKTRLLRHALRFGIIRRASPRLRFSCFAASFLLACALTFVATGWIALGGLLVGMVLLLRRQWDLLAGMVLGPALLVGALLSLDAGLVTTEESHSDALVQVDRCWSAEWGGRCLLSTEEGRRWYLTWPGFDLPDAGQWGRVDVQLRPWTTTFVPGESTFALWLLRHGVVARGAVEAFHPVPASGLDRWRLMLRDWLRTRDLGDAEQGVYQALVLGDRSAMSAELRGQVNRTQTQHLLALSGLHIGSLALWAYGITGLLWRLKPMGCRQTWQKSAALVTAGALLFVALPAVSLWRAFLMLLVPGLFWLVKRRLAPFKLLLLIGFMMAISDSLIWLDLGAWFSWWATLILVMLVRQIGHWPGWWQLIMIQLTLSVLLIPVHALWELPVFPQGMVLNLILIPLVTFVALPAAFLTAFHVPWAAEVFSLSVAVWTQLLAWFDRPWSMFPIISPWQALLALMMTGVLLGVRVGWQAWSLAVALAGLLMWHHGRPVPLDAGEYELWVLDAGQALSVVVDTGEGRVLFDTGRGDGESVHLGQPALRWHWRYPGRTWQAVILSHNNPRHVGGRTAVARDITPGVVYAGEPPHSVPQDWPAARFCDQGEHFELGGVQFEFERPVPGYMPTESSDRSCVLRIHSPHGDALVMGGAGRRVEYGLLQHGAVEPVEVLVSGRLGGNQATSEAWLNELKPRWVAHSSGAHGLYPRPHEEVLQRVQSTRGENHCTCWSGTLHYSVREGGIIPASYGNRLLPWLKIVSR